VQALRLALALNARQVSFVASATKALVLKESLVAGGADQAAVADIVAPAGYPMAATTPEEIALSVLAAVVSHRRGSTSIVAPVAKQAAPVVATATTASCCGGEKAEVAAIAPPPPIAKSSCCGG
jgi:xanthine dehydrogenase accessory factor